MDFLLMILIEPVLAVVGTSIGEARAREVGGDRKRWAMIGTGTGVAVGFLAVFTLLCSGLAYEEWSVLLEMAGIWAVHSGLVALVALCGVQVAYDPRRSEVVYRGPMLACLMALPLTCLPLMLLMMY